MYRAIFVLGYFGMLRVGELTEAESDHTIRLGDVHIDRDKDKILIVLKSSKTHTNANKPQIVKIERKYEQEFKLIGDLCPCTLICEYLMQRGIDFRDESAFFIFRDGSPMKAQHFQKVLKDAVRKLNLNQDLYDTHSLRIGRTHDLFKWGVPVNKIKECGHWRSKAVYNYLII